MKEIQNESRYDYNKRKLIFKKSMKSEISSKLEQIQNFFYFIFLLNILIFPILSQASKCNNYKQEIIVKTNKAVDSKYSINKFSCVEKKSTNVYLLKFSDKASCHHLFKGMTLITEVDLTNFHPINLNDAESMFNGCSSLVSINFGNFDTSLVTNMNSMFNGCSSLVSLNLSSFNTSKLTTMGHLFFNCISLKYLDISSFNTSKVKYMDNIFKNCRSITSLNLSNFESLNVINFKGMFMNCQNLSYINLQRFQIKDDSVNINDIFSGINTNFVIYIDENSKLLKNMIVNNKNNCSIIISSKIDNSQKKLLYINNQTKICTYDCNELRLHNCEYKGNCYEQCPKIITTYMENVITTEEIKEKVSTEIVYNNNTNTHNNTIIINDTVNKDIDIIINNKTNCEMSDFIMNKCTKNFSKEKEKNSFKKDIISSIKNGSLSEILNEVIKKGTNLIIQNGKELYQISTLSNQIKKNNISYINFMQCVQILKEKNITNENEDLLMFKVEHKIDSYNIPIIEYALFKENGSLLNLELCNNIISKYFIPVSINENDFDKYNPSSEYYNNECKKSSEDGSDLTIYDRKYNYNNKNMSLCEANCTLEGFDSDESKVECDCKVKSYLLTEENLNKDNLLNKLEYSQSNNNLNLMKCVNSFSLEEDIQSNSGFYLLLIIIILFITIMIIFCVKGFQSLENKIDEVIYSKFKPNKKKKPKTLVLNKQKNKKRKNKIKNKNRKIKIDSNTKSKGTILNENNIIKNVEIIQNKNLNTDIIQEEENIDYENDYELNTLSYKLALTYDRRECCDYYFSLIKNKQIIFFSFFFNNDYNSGVIKKFIFFLSFSLHYTINALFFTDKIMHQIYQDGGKYNIIFQFPYIMYSAIISTVILRIILTTLVLTEKSILEVKKQQTGKLAKDKKIKVINKKKK